MNLRKYIGDRNFYRYVLAIVIPMVLQNVVTNFVSMLDNIMVGQVGTAQMSGVSIVNQFIFVCNLTLFGGMAGPSIFGAQYYGKGDHVGQRYSFRFRLILSTIIVTAAMFVLGTFAEPLISLFLSKDDAPEAVAATLHYGKEYMMIVLFSMIPFGISQAYSSVVRECGETRIPMFSSLAAVGVNLVLDYALIFGKFGFPQMGVAGAALATVIAKAVEAVVIVTWAHTHQEKNKFIVGLYRDFSIPKELVFAMIKRGYPLLINECLWSIGMSAVAQCYSVRGLDVVAARNISSTMVNLFNVIHLQVGSSIGIIVGQQLGAGRFEEAKDVDRKLLAFAVFMGAVVGTAMLPVAKYFPMLYNTEQEIRDLASFMILVTALIMPFWAYTNGCYWTLRCGGRTGITFLFDFGFTWLLMLPLAFVLAYFTRVDIHLIFVIVTWSELVKVAIGFFMVRSGMWVRRIVS